MIGEYLKVDERWIPEGRGYSLYLRPTMIGTQETLGVSASQRALLFVIGCPVGPYYSTGFSAIKLQATTEYVRAWPRGTGDAKIGGNYAPGMLPQQLAAKLGYQQNLWLFGGMLRAFFITPLYSSLGRQPRTYRGGCDEPLHSVEERCERA